MYLAHHVIFHHTNHELREVILWEYSIFNFPFRGNIPCGKSLNNGLVTEKDRSLENKNN